MNNNKTGSMRQPDESIKNNPSKMVPWKQAMVTALGVYPLLLSYEWLVKLVLPVQLMDRRVTLLIVVMMIATTMVFLVMPLLIRLFGPWLFKKQS